ncbi:MAG: hypothetical protein WEC80_01215 [Patescibacteria group bacterium]
MKIKYFLLSLMTLAFVIGGTVIGQESTGELEEIQEFKEKLASKVAELQQDEEKALAGFASDINETSLKITTHNGEVYDVELDDLLTKYFLISGNSLDELSSEDISDDDYLIITGPVDGKIISANNIYTDIRFVSGSGIVSQVNQGNSLLTVITLENNTLEIEVETSTERQILDIESLEFDTVNFSTIKTGDVVHFIYQEANEENANDRYSASKILVIPQEYFSK